MFCHLLKMNIECNVKFAILCKSSIIYAVECVLLYNILVLTYSDSLDHIWKLYAFRKYLTCFLKSSIKLFTPFTKWYPASEHDLYMTDEQTDFKTWLLQDVNTVTKVEAVKLSASHRRATRTQSCAVVLASSIINHLSKVACVWGIIPRQKNFRTPA